MTSMVFKKRVQDSDSKKHDKPATVFGRLRSRYGAIECGEVHNRKHVTVVGEISSTRLVPRADGYWFEVVINDGTGKIDGWFFGRRSIEGMHLGAKILLKGLVQLDQGELTIANPYYEFL